MSYKLRVNILTSFLHELRVTSYFYYTICEILFGQKLQVTIYYTSYKLLFTYDLRATVYCNSYELHLLNELQVTF